MFICESSPVNRKNLIRYQIPSVRGYLIADKQESRKRLASAKRREKSFCILALLNCQEKTIS